MCTLDREDRAFALKLARTHGRYLVSDEIQGDSHMAAVNTLDQLDLPGTDENIKFILRGIPELYGQDPEVGLDEGLVDEMLKTYKGRVRFLMIYIIEAHSSDEGWPVGEKISCIKQAKTLQDRIQAARYLISIDSNCSLTDDITSTTHIPVVIDDMDNTFNTRYAAYPDRYYIIHNEQIQVIGPTVKEIVELLPRSIMSGLEKYLKY